jgi:imidazolonepropionase-like amidohydrolase
MGPAQSLQQRLLTPYSLGIAQAFANAKLRLDSGFTTVRDPGGTPRGVKMAIDQGLFPGPRLRIAVGALSQTGGHGDAVMPNGANIRIGDPLSGIKILQDSARLPLIMKDGKPHKNEIGARVHTAS